MVASPAALMSASAEASDDVHLIGFEIRAIIATLLLSVYLFRHRTNSKLIAVPVRSGLVRQMVSARVERAIRE